MKIKAGDKIKFYNSNLKSLKEWDNIGYPGIDMDKKMLKIMDGKTIYTVKKIFHNNNNLFSIIKSNWSWRIDWIKEIVGKDMMDFNELDKVIGIMEGNKDGIK